MWYILYIVGAGLLLPQSRFLLIPWVRRNKGEEGNFQPRHQMYPVHATSTSRPSEKVIRVHMCIYSP